MSKSTILIERETRQLLRKIGRKEQTYDDLINELVARCEKEDLSGSGFETPAARQIVKLYAESNESKGVHS